MGVGRLPTHFPGIRRLPCDALACTLIRMDWLLEFLVTLACVGVALLIYAYATALLNE